MLFLLLQDAMTELTVEKFSPFWWKTSGITIVCIILFTWILVKRPPAQYPVIRKAIGWITLVWALILIPAHYFFEETYNIRYGLPFQLCDIAAYFVVIACFTKKQWAYEIAMYFGILGAFNALLTPQFTQGMHWFFIIEFFWSHLLLFVGPLFLTFGEKMRLSEWSWLRNFGYLNLTAAIVFTINKLIDANYMFLVKAPTAKSPFLFTKVWPWYIGGMEIAAFLFMVVIYLPFYFAKRRNQSLSL